MLSSLSFCLSRLPLLPSQTWTWATTTSKTCEHACDLTKTTDLFWTPAQTLTWRATTFPTSYHRCLCRSGCAYMTVTVVCFNERFHIWGRVLVRAQRWPRGREARRDEREAKQVLRVMCSGVVKRGALVRLWRPFWFWVITKDCCWWGYRSTNKTESRLSIVWIWNILLWEFTTVCQVHV